MVQLQGTATKIYSVLLKYRTCGSSCCGIQHCRQLWRRLQLHLGFGAWPETLHMLWVQPKKKKIHTHTHTHTHTYNTYVCVCICVCMYRTCVSHQITGSILFSCMTLACPCVSELLASLLFAWGLVLISTMGRK